MDETSKFFQKFNATALALLIKFRPLGEEEEPTVYLLECITALTNYLIGDESGRDLLGLNVQEKMVDISFRRRNQLEPDVICVEKSTYAMFGLNDRFAVLLDPSMMPAINGRETIKERSLNVKSSIKRALLSRRHSSVRLMH